MRTVNCHKTLADVTRELGADATRPLVVLDDDGRFLGIVGDPELRNAYLRGDPATIAVTSIMDRDSPTTDASCTEKDLETRLADSRAAAIVTLDADGRPVALRTRRDALGPDRLVKSAVLMAGGEGKRLRPLTTDLPKPMLPIAGRPILEHIIEHVVRHGVSRVVISLGYLAEKIERHFGDGKDFGVAIDYVREPRPLGTAGAIGMVDVDADGALLVMNGDLLTDVDLQAMQEFHGRESAAVTLAVRSYHHRVPYGVLRLIDHRVVSLDEKPVSSWWTNAGIYIVDSRAVARIPKNTYLDMTVFIERLISDGERVCAFPVREFWCDIGLPSDYLAADREWSTRSK